MATQIGAYPRHVVIFDDRIEIWRGFGEGNWPRRYTVNRERAHRLGRLLDTGASVMKLRGGMVYYSWNEFGKGGK